MYHAHEDVSLMAQNLIQIKTGTMITVSVNEKSHKTSGVQKNIIFGILLNVLVTKL